jgi:hypothetical protein
MDRKGLEGLTANQLANRFSIHEKDLLANA